eukprot:TRINITY_DN12912_c0_g1_i1.p1 TRINITY_DN12912_c0_g1~~TRINITY_DN12912_c0_g1_i1.p1  ORF type:complete len:234 (+),score=50.18 TRINITY_DN12912_c0_g1_i1:229-930(+)
MEGVYRDIWEAVLRHFFDRYWIDERPTSTESKNHLKSRLKREKVLSLKQFRDWKSIRRVNREWNALSDRLYEFENNEPWQRACREGNLDALVFFIEKTSLGRNKSGELSTSMIAAAIDSSNTKAAIHIIRRSKDNFNQTDIERCIRIPEVWHVMCQDDRMSDGVMEWVLYSCLNKYERMSGSEKREYNLPEFIRACLNSKKGDLGQHLELVIRTGCADSIQIFQQDERINPKR